MTALTNSGPATNSLPERLGGGLLLCSLVGSLLPALLNVLAGQGTAAAAYSCNPCGEPLLQL